jgi:hypothetical protein
MESYAVSGVQGQGKRVGQKALVVELYDTDDFLIKFMCYP